METIYKVFEAKTKEGLELLIKPYVDEAIINFIEGIYIYTEVDEIGAVVCRYSQSSLVDRILI